jgi:hypothetical protein
VDERVRPEGKMTFKEATAWIKVNRGSLNEGIGGRGLDDDSSHWLKLTVVVNGEECSREVDYDGTRPDYEAGVIMAVTHVVQVMEELGIAS